MIAFIEHNIIIQSSVLVHPVCEAAFLLSKNNVCTLQISKENNWYVFYAFDGNEHLKCKIDKKLTA